MTFTRPGLLAYHVTENGAPTGEIIVRQTNDFPEVKLSPEDCAAFAQYITS